MTIASDRFDPELRRGTRVEIVTPECVPLSFSVASTGARVYALAIDALCIAAGVFVTLVLLVIAAFGDSEALASFALLAFFLLRNGWFLFFELRNQGRTPGKSFAQIRVVDARGGPLEPISLVVRNLTREFEIFAPLLLLTNPESVAQSGPVWVRWLSVLWVLGVLVIPLADSRRRRLGDLLAGTMVVRDPRRRLQRDLADDERASQRARSEDDKAIFSTRQLEMYGVYELQVLESLLRDEPRRSATLDAVAERVVRKIGWTGELRALGGARAFLEAFYGAQRARLEHDLALGRARESKRAGRLG